MKLPVRRSRSVSVQVPTALAQRRSPVSEGNKRQLISLKILCYLPEFVRRLVVLLDCLDWVMVRSPTDAPCVMTKLVGIGKLDSLENKLCIRYRASICETYSFVRANLAAALVYTATDSSNFAWTSFS